MKRYSIVFDTLVVSNALTVLIGLLVSVDVRSWWPLLLVVGVLWSGLLAGVLSLLNRIVHESSLRFVLYLTGVLAATRLLHAGLFYLARSDRWLMSEGGFALSVVERVVVSDYTPWVLDILFLLFAAGWSCWQRCGGASRITRDRS